MAPPLHSTFCISHSPRRKRGAALLWTLAALALAVAMLPLYVGLCQSLSRLTARGGHRLIATRVGTREMEGLRQGRVLRKQFPVAELPGGQGELHLEPMAGTRLRKARLTLTWQEGGATGPVGRAEWTTLLPEVRP